MTTRLGRLSTESWRYCPGGRYGRCGCFGAVAVMVDDAMAVAAYQGGNLLVRVDATDDPRLLQRPEVSRAEMGTGRSMGEGWIRVDAKVLGDDTALNDWLETAAGYLARRS